MSWLRAIMRSGSSCRYSIARMACSVPSMPRQRRPGHKPCLPRMKRRAVSMVMVSMMTSWRDSPPDRSEMLWNPVLCSLLSSGQRSVDPVSGCASWSHVPWRDLSLLLNCKLRPAPDHRKRAEEYLAAIRTIWSEGTAAYHGRYVSFQDVMAYPHPVQQPAPPIVVGGSAAAVLRRALEQANGWYGFALDLDETTALLAQLREAAGRYQRPAWLGELEISVAPRVPLDKDTALRFADLGVHRLILIPPPGIDA